MRQKNFGDKSKTTMCITIMVMLLIVILPANAELVAEHIVINQVLYDPLDTESGGEAVELYNPTDTEIDISGYILRTESSDFDVTIPDGETITAKGYYLITDTGWETNKDNSSWKNADYEESITMTNTNAGVALLDSTETIVDAVGWGDTAEIEMGLYETVPTDGSSPGEGLIRITETNNNYNDFIIGLVDFSEHTNEVNETSDKNETILDDASQNIELNVNVQNTPPTIKILYVDDDMEEIGTQILPVPGETRNVNMNIIIHDKDGIEGVTLNTTNVDLIVNEIEEINYTTKIYNVSTQMNFYDDADTYTIMYEVKDVSSTTYKNVSFEYMSMTAVYIDTTSLAFSDAKIGQFNELNGDFALSTHDTPTIRNIGNSITDFGIYGEDFLSGTDSIEIENLKYSFDNDYESTISGTISDSMSTANVGLTYGLDSVISLGFQFYIPTTTKNGDYTGSVSVVALKR